MKASFTGWDYFLYIEKNKDDIENLRTSKLETMLQFGGDDSTDKKVTLELRDKVNNPDGIEVLFLPKHPKSWKHIKEINVVINEKALNHIVDGDGFWTHYNSRGNIDIYWTYYRMISIGLTE